MWPRLQLVLLLSVVSTSVVTASTAADSLISRLNESAPGTNGTASAPSQAINPANPRMPKLNTLTTNCNDACATNSACIIIGTDSALAPNCTGTMQKCFTELSDAIKCVAPGYTDSTSEWEFAATRNISKYSGNGPFQALGILDMNQAKILRFGRAHESLFPLMTPLDVSGMAVTPGANLTTVEFSRVNLTGLDQAAPLDEVFVININRCDLKDIPVGFVSGNQVTFLDLSGNQISTATALDKHIFTNLTKLNLTSNKLDKFDVKATTLPAITTLSLSNNKLKTIPSVVFKLPTLKRLEIDGNPLAVVEMSTDDVAFLVGLKTLKLSSPIRTTACPADKDVRSKLANYFEFCASVKDNDGASSHGGASNKTWTILGALLGVLVFFAVTICIYRRVKIRRDREPKHMTQSHQPTAVLEEYGQHAYHAMPPQVSDKSSNNTTSEYDLASTLDEGFLNMVRLAYNDVFLHNMIRVSSRSELWVGELHDERVIIKKIKSNSASRSVMSSFIMEIEQMAQIKHPRIVTFRGALWDTEGTELCAVAQYVENGALREMINRKLSLPVPKQHTIARQVAEALTFLHERNVIHGRLNSKNVLLDREFSAKLSLFAIFHHAQLSPLDMEAAMFVAPEVRRGERPTDKADVYSFGVILVELDSEETPLANSKRTSSLMHQTTAEGVSPTTRRTGFRFSTTCSSMMKEIVMACLERDPELRPTMAEISSSLKTGEMTL